MNEHLKLKPEVRIERVSTDVSRRGPVLLSMSPVYRSVNMKNSVYVGE